MLFPQSLRDGQPDTVVWTCFGKFHAPFRSKSGERFRIRPPPTPPLWPLLPDFCLSDSLEAVRKPPGNRWQIAAVWNFFGACQRPVALRTGAENVLFLQRAMRPYELVHVVAAGARRSRINHIALQNVIGNAIFPRGSIQSDFRRRLQCPFRSAIWMHPRLPPFRR